MAFMSVRYIPPASRTATSTATTHTAQTIISHNSNSRDQSHSICSRTHTFFLRFQNRLVFASGVSGVRAFLSRIKLFGHISRPSGSSDRDKLFCAMATIVCASVEASARSLLQRSFLRPCEPTSSALAAPSSWKSKSLRSDGCSKVASERSRGFGLAARAAVVPDLYVESEPSRHREEETSTSELLCCPICFKPLCRNGPTGLTLDAIKRSGFSCKNCRRSFINKDVYLDLTILEGSKVYDETRTPGSEIFRSPLVSFAYERGWRNSFVLANFPGPDEEFMMAQDYFKPVVGGVLIDVSCGSGLFTRRFAQSGDYKSVIALDFSENMLRQSDQFIKQDTSLTTSNIALVRADVARLPFATGSIDAVHAGAALHCWPSPAAGMAEISRILKPGGVFVATNFLQPIPIFDFGIKDVRRAIKRALNSSSVHFWEEAELEELCGTCGLVEYSRIRRGQFIMISAKKAQDTQI